MNKNVYVLLGNDIFKKLNIVKNDFSDVDSNSVVYKLISTLNIPSCPSIENIFLGWSFILFKTVQGITYSGFRTSVIEQQSNKLFSNLFEVFHIACGLSNSFILFKSGILYHFTNINFEPKLIEAQIENANFKKVDTEDLYTAALTEDGRVFDIKVDETVSAIHCNVPLIITEIACGKEHVLLLSSSGVVLSYGIGSRGQLGHGNIHKIDSPKIIEALDGLQMKSISAGGWHSAAISYIGDLYMWGWNESGQLGLPCSQLHSDVSFEEVYSICCLPKIIELEDIEVKSVSCGSRHTAAITVDNNVWAWGWNNYNQLGNKECLLTDKPQRISLPDNFMPQDIKCKFWNTLITGYFE